MKKLILTIALSLISANFAFAADTAEKSVPVKTLSDVHDAKTNEVVVPKGTVVKAEVATKEVKPAKDTCPVGDLTLKKVSNKRVEWTLMSSSKHKQWMMIKNKDTQNLYPLMEVKKERGVVGPFEKNKNGYDVLVMEVSKEESAAIKTDQSTCSKKGDCSLKIKLNRCVVDQKPL